LAFRRKFAVTRESKEKDYDVSEVSQASEVSQTVLNKAKGINYSNSDDDKEFLT